RQGRGGEQPQAGKGVEPTPNQEQAPAQPAEGPEGVEAAIQQEAPAQFPDIPLEAEPLSLQEQLAESPEEAETSVLQQASSQSPQNNKPTVIPPGHSQDHHSVLTNVLKPVGLEFTTIQPADVVGTSSIHHEDASQPLVPVSNEELSGTQHEVPTLAVEPPEALEPFPVQQEAVNQSPEPARDEKPSPAQQEATAEQSQAPEEIEASLTETSLAEQEAPIELSQAIEVKPFVSHQKAPVQLPASPMEYTTYPFLNDEITFSPLPLHKTQHPMVPNTKVKHVALGLVTPEPTTEVEYSSVQQEDLIQPLIATGQVEFPPTQSNLLSQPPEPHIKFEYFPAHQEAIAQAPDTFKKVEPSPDQLAEPSSAYQEAPPQLLRPPNELKPSSVKQAAPVQSPESLMMVEPSLAQQRAPSLPPELREEMESLPTQQDITALPPEPLKRVKSAPVKQTTPSQLSEPRKVVAAESPASYEMTVPTSGHQTQSPTLPSVGFQPLDLMVTITQEPTIRVEHSTTLKTTTRHPNLVQTQYPNLNEVTVQPVDVEVTITSQPTTEDELAPALQETPTQTATEGFVPRPTVYQEVTVPTTPSQGQSQYPTSPGVTPEHLDLGLTVTPELSMEAEHSTGLKETTAPPKYPEVALPHSGGVQVQNPNLTEVTITPQPTTEDQLATPMQETPQPPTVIIVTQPSVNQEVTVPTTPSQGQSQYLTSPSVTTAHLDLGLTISPESSTELEPSPVMEDTLTQPSEPSKESESQPAAYYETIIPTSAQDQSQHSASSTITVQPFDLALTITPESTLEFKHPSAVKKTVAASKEVESQSPVYYEIVPTSAQDQAQHPVSSSATGQPLDLVLTITAGIKHPTTLPKTVTPYLHQVHTQRPTLPQDTSHPLNLEITTNQPPRSSESVSLSSKTLMMTSRMDLNAQPELITTVNGNLCDLCSCINETLSCVGLNSKQKLQQVPVPDPSIHNDTFTVL
ncbi:leucine-rich repeat-containing protein 37A-like, partial [Tupaia chinensis]|uniref:leucine-rich repeat-containing protein 37A-like n=1 Tax=Tupaia chinensis TaxID=246437 RepID=UPI000FFBB284